MEADPTHLAHTIDAIASLLVALVLGYSARVHGTRAVATWALGWSARAIAAIVLALMPSLGRVAWGLHLLGEWAFLTAVCVGARELGSAFSVRRRVWLGLLLLGGIVAALATRAPSYGSLALRELLVIAVTTGLAAWLVGRAREGERAAGTVLLRASLLALSVLSVARLALWRWGELPPVADALALAPTIEAGLGGLVALSMVLVAADRAHLALELADGELRRSRDELARLARIDPLTEVFHRHAFRTLLSGLTRVQGTVIVVEVDELERIHEEDGAAVAERSVRAAAGAVRRLIRPEDLLVRWNASELIVLLPNVPRDAAGDRFAVLNVGALVKHGPDSSHVLLLSWGAAGFGDGTSLQDAIAQARRNVERHRAARRAFTRGEATSLAKPTAD